MGSAQLTPMVLTAERLGFELGASGCTGYGVAQPHPLFHWNHDLRTVRADVIWPAQRGSWVANTGLWPQPAWQRSMQTAQALLSILSPLSQGEIPITEQRTLSKCAVQWYLVHPQRWAANHHLFLIPKH